MELPKSPSLLEIAAGSGGLTTLAASPTVFKHAADNLVGVPLVQKVAASRVGMLPAHLPALPKRVRD